MRPYQASRYAEFNLPIRAATIVSKKKGNKGRESRLVPPEKYLATLLFTRASRPFPSSSTGSSHQTEPPDQNLLQTSPGPLQKNFKPQFSDHVTPQNPRPSQPPQRTHLPISNFPPAQHLPNLLAPPQHPLAASPGSACPTLVPSESPTVPPKDSPRRLLRIGDFTRGGRIRKRYCLR